MKAKVFIEQIKILADCLVTLIWKDRIKISKYIINDRVNKNNVDEFYTEFIKYSSKNNFENDELKTKYKELENMLLKIKMN